MGPAKKMPDFMTLFNSSLVRKMVATVILSTFSIVSACSSHANDAGAETHVNSEAGHSTAHNEQAKPEKYDPGKMIIDHIADAHDWHLWGEGHDAVSISLPVSR